MLNLNTEVHYSSCPPSFTTPFLCLWVFLDACAAYPHWSLTVWPVAFWPAVLELFSILWAPLSLFLSVRSVSVGRVSSGRDSSDGSESSRAGQFWVWRGVQRCSHAQVCVCVSLKNSLRHLHNFSFRWFAGGLHLFHLLHPELLAK